MTVRINDNRAALAMTGEDADRVFQNLAETVIAATVAAAQADEQIAAIKAQAAEVREEYMKIIKPLETTLEDYINAHPERFIKPRMRKTEFGQYGLRSVTNLEISDEIAAMISCKAQGIQAIVVTEKLNKKAVEKAISDGRQITGCEIRTGEIVKYDVRRELLDRTSK